jgi:hypothetical protein
LLHPLAQHESPAEQDGPPLQPIIVVPQAEFTQDPCGQTLPQKPQFFGSLVVSMHPSPGQHDWPTLQLQIWTPQTVPPGPSAQHCP